MNDALLHNAATESLLAPLRRQDSELASRLHRVESLMLHLGAGDRLDRIGAMVHDHLATGGKRLRARLALMACDALGCDPDAAIGWAAACELLHNASLVHDDLQDGDTVRRGHPTTWARHGMAQAINVGDLLLMLPPLAVDAIQTDDCVRYRLCRALAAGAAETVRGQSAEMDLLPFERLDVDSYNRVVEGKTAALLALPVQGAALLAGHTDAHALALAEPFRAIGLLFQLQDDVLDLYGDKGRAERGADLREGKVSALVVEHIAGCPADRERLIGLLRTPREVTSATEVDWAIEAFVDSGALDRVIARMEGLSRQVALCPILRAEPMLRTVAIGLIERTLQPIRHLCSPLSDDVAS